MSTVRTGGCLCGSVRFQARGEPLRTLVCHCKFCQRMTGTTSYAESMYPIDAVSLSGRAPSVYEHRSETSAKVVYVHFCSNCGSTVSLTFERWPEYRAISRGAFDEPNSVAITSHIWTDSAQSGVVLPANTDCFGQARAALDGTARTPQRHGSPVLARSDDESSGQAVTPGRSHVGVGVGVLVIQDGLILLGKRRGSHGASTWSAPGGRLEFGEEIIECAARELREEVGVDASSYELGPYTNDQFPEVQEQDVTIFVVARGIKGIPMNLEPHKCEGWAWFKWGEWPSPLFGPCQSLLDIGWRPGGT